MKADLGDLHAFLAVARAGGFREARARQRRQRLGAERGGAPAGDAARRAAAAPHHAQRRCRPRRARACSSGSAPALGEVEAALDVVNGFRDRPAGTLRLNVPVSAARLVLPGIVPAFLAAYPDIRLEIDRRGQLRRRAGRRLRRRHPLRRAAGAGHDRGADRAARAALRHRRVARPISTATAGPSIRATCSAMPACAAASPAAR